MKLQTTQVGRWGKENKVNNVLIKWNDRGVGEVKDDKIAKEILEDHDDIFKEGEVPAPKPKVEVKKDDSKEVEGLKVKINTLEARLETAKGEIETLTNVKEQLIKDVEASAAELKPVEGGKLTEEDVQTIVGILESNKEDLIEAVKADPETFPEKEWAEKNKKDLQIYIILKSF